MQFVDTHSHLYLDDFDSDRNEVIARARSVGVQKIVLPAIDSTHHLKQISVTQEAPDLFVPLMGLHPVSVKDPWESELERVEQYLRSGEFMGVGEVGIDLYWDKTYIDQQLHVFRQQVKWAKELRLPLVIHTRNAFPEVFHIIDREHDENLFGVFHSFSGTLNDYNHIAAYGSFMIGIGGVVTYKNSGLAGMLSQMDTKLLVLETDAPYLPPVPFRGKRNESSYLPLVAEKIAQAIGCLPQEVAQFTSQNAAKLFNISL